MRRRILLYIDGSLADIPGDATVLMNYAVTDLTNPAILKNSCSWDFDLPRTPANDRIFGHSGRLDRIAGPGGLGPDFNASRKTPFVIYAETSEVLASGYVKLRSVTRDAYRVSLFGGLGEFLWGLSYGPDGEKRSLADLDFGVDLDFTITKETVAEAWARLGGDTSKPDKWDVINFAPAYNGVPSDFSADKAVAAPGGVSQDIPAGYNTQSGFALIGLSGEHDEWEVRDLRSYLQRPVVSMAKILAAIADPANNGGWSVDLSALTISYQTTWLTRPLLPSLGTYKQTSGGVSISYQAYSAGTVVGRFTLANVPAGTEITARVKSDLRYTVPGASPNTPLRAFKWRSAGPYVPSAWEQQVLFVQAVAYASDNSFVAAGPVRSFYKSAPDIAPADLAAALGFTPKGDGTYAAGSADHGYSLDGGYYFRQRELEAEVTGANIARIDLEVTAYYAVIHGAIVLSHSGGTAPFARLWDYSDNQYIPTVGGSTTGSGSAAGTSSDALRSGATITKEMLLSTSKTPAEYLVSFCKAFGCYILADSATKTVKVLPREAFFQNEVTDLTGRVDATSIDIDPIAFDAKWYELRQESVGGRFEEEYRRTSGVQYGIKRIDTGYSFDANTKDLLSGSAFKSCASVQARSKYFCQLLTPGGVWYPSVFMDPGNTMTLWDSNGDPKEFDVVVPGSAQPDPTNPDLPFYDLSDRPEFRDGENAPVDGSDVLLFFRGAGRVQPYYTLTDDLPIMDTLNGGPCWILQGAGPGIRIPEFSRYWVLTPLGGSKASVALSLDFGIPREIDIPEISYAAGTVYQKRWRNYMEDRLSVHGKVLRCRVLLEGLQVGPELLRRFYWYKGSLWALVSISNYSLTSFDPAECEFVQVQDIDNYLI